MITETRNIYESLEELIRNTEGAAVGDFVLVVEGILPEYTPYVVAHRNGDELIILRKNIMARLMPMKINEFDLTKWLNEDFRDRILKSLPEDLRDRIGEVNLPSIKEVYGEAYGEEPEGEQFEWFKERINRIAIKEDEECSDWYWLRDVVSGTHFARVNTNGHVSYTGASLPWVGVRPILSIKMTANL